MIIDRKQGYLTIVKGPPSCGKTNLALRDAIYNVEIEKGVVLFVSLETSKEGLVRQCKYAILRDINIEEYTNFIVVDDDIYYDLDKLADDIKRIKPKTVYIDSMFLLNLGDREMKLNAPERFIYFCKALSDIALEFNIEIVVLKPEHRTYRYNKSMSIVYDGPFGYNCIKKHINNNNIIGLFMDDDGTIFYIK